MLDNSVIKKIEDFVYSKPRSIQEIAEHINKNWRTADRYVDAISKDFGTIATRVFRGGTRGALKIVYWSSIEKVSSSIFQEKLEKDILEEKEKDNFSGFDIFQHIPDKDKKAKIEKARDENLTDLKEIADILRRAEKQVLVFSGNLSFINLKNNDEDLFRLFEGLVKRKVNIKVICRVDLAGKENIERMLSLNFKYGKEMVEIRHREQPLRAMVIDNKIFRIKEVKDSTGKIHELNEKIFIFYTIKSKEWAEWISRIFWKMFSSSISAQKRIEEMKKI